MYQKQRESKKLEKAIQKFVKSGGEVVQLEKGQYQTFRSPCFDKSQDELQAMAKKYKRKTFTYWCDKHGICQFSVKKNACIRCGVSHEKA